jgi:hypothetical protein
MASGAHETQPALAGDDVLKVSVGLAATVAGTSATGKSGGPGPASSAAVSSKSARQLEIENLRNSMMGVVSQGSGRQRNADEQPLAAGDGEEERQSRATSRPAPAAGDGVDARFATTADALQRDNVDGREDQARWRTSSTAGGTTDRENNSSARARTVANDDLVDEDDEEDDEQQEEGQDDNGSEDEQREQRGNSSREAPAAGDDDNEEFDEAELEEALRNLDDKDRRILGLMAQLEDVRSLHGTVRVI